MSKIEITAFKHNAIPYYKNNYKLHWLRHYKGLWIIL